jgi:hypothetical protein
MCKVLAIWSVQVQLKRKKVSISNSNSGLCYHCHLTCTTREQIGHELSQFWQLRFRDQISYNSAINFVTA